MSILRIWSSAATTVTLLGLLAVITVIGQQGTLDESRYNNVSEVHMAIIENDYQKLEGLLKSGEDPNKRTSGGDTPMHYALRPRPSTSDRAYGQVQVLLQHGANPYSTNNQGVSPVEIAVIYGDEPIMDLLFKYGVAPNTILSSGISMLTSARMYGRDDIAKSIRNHGGTVGSSEQEAMLIANIDKHEKGMKRIRSMVGSHVSEGQLNKQSFVVALRSILNSDMDFLKEDEIDQLISNFQANSDCNSCGD